MNNSFGISDQSFNELINGLKQYPEIEQARIFGSRAMNTYKKGSDIDIALFGPRLKQATIDKLAIYMDEETIIPYYIDFINYNTLDNDELIKHIDEKGVVFYEKTRAK